MAPARRDRRAPDLFDLERQREVGSLAPLAARMRPRTLDELVGQEAIVGPGTPLRRAIEGDRLGSVIFCGPPGTGKTTLARIVAGVTGRYFEQLNAVTGGVADIRRVVDEARQRLAIQGRRTILFIDEIHRFNRAQQDALLPYVEDGLVSLVGATAQNPFIDCIPALISRCRVYRLAPLRPEHLLLLLRRALADAERGLGGMRCEVSPDALEHMARMAAGDARNALNALELAVTTTPPGPDGVRRVGLAEAEESMQRPALRYDRDGDQHHDTVSAFIKSIRGSDPDAAVYWLARMLAAGEDPRFIARRMVIAASEDIGNADPSALPLAVAAAQAAEMVGLPESRIPLSQAATYLACAPKSNAAYLAIERAMSEVEGPAPEVPAHLRALPSERAANLEGRRGYLYPHDYPGHHVPQQYLPDGLAGRRYYEPSEQGEEATIGRRLDAWRTAVDREFKRMLP